MVKRRALFVLTFVITVCSMAGGASSTVYVDAAASAGGDGDSWHAAYQSIQAGINDVSAALEDVWVAQGVYKEAIEMVTGVSVYGGFVSGETVFGNRDPLAYTTLIDGSTAGVIEGYGVQHVVLIKDVTGTELNGFQIAGGYAMMSGDAVSGAGAGIYCESADGSNTVRNCVIASNYSIISGGGLACYQSDILFENCTIAGNQSLLGGGAACVDASPTFRNCIFTGNNASEGGGAMTRSHASPSFQNCTFYWNGAIGSFTFNPQGGGISCESSSPTLVNCIFRQNIGGAVYESDNKAEPEVKNCLFDTNYQCDYYDHFIKEITGANDINMEISRANDNRTGPAAFVMGVSGTWTAEAVYDATENRTTLTDTNASFTPGALVGKIINIGWGIPVYYLITDNTSTTIEILGDTYYTVDGDDYQIIDLHLQDGSAALDRAYSTAAPSFDFEDDARPGSDSLFDIGADEAPFAYEPPTDVTNPVSEVRSLGKYSAPATFDVPFVASDAEDGLQYVELYYQKDGGFIQKYGSTYTASPISFDSGTTGGDGIYRFYTIAWDMAGNMEAPPSIPDATTRVIGSFSASHVYVDVDASGSDTGENWTDAFNALDLGMFVAGAFSVSDVWVADGTYEQVVEMMNYVSLYGGFDGTETSLSERNHHQNIAAIDVSTANNGSPAATAVLMENVSNSRIDGFVITGAYGSAYGGGISAENADETNVIANCTIYGNRAYGGGGIYLENSAPIIDTCAVRDNEVSGFGGGIASYFGSSLDLRNSIIMNNTAIGAGGGIQTNYSAVTISDCIVEGNECTYYDSLGGGINIRSNADAMEISNCVFNDNYAGWCGGGAYIYEASPTFNNCVFTKNEAQWGGAAMTSYDCSPSFVNCTVVENIGPAAGGIYVYYSSTPRFVNTIFAGNEDCAIVEGSGEMFPTAPLYCSFFDNGTCDYDNSNIPLTGAAQINALFGASGNIDGDPMFVNIAEGDYRLSNLSPCVDAGTSTLAPSTDILGFTRPHDVPGRGASGADTYDIGAFENQDTGAYTPTNTPTATDTPVIVVTPSSTPTRSSGVEGWRAYE